jgi:UDP-N-acetylmuramate dehydrogenase
MNKTIDFSKYSSIKIGPKAKVKVIYNIDKSNEAYQIIGKASNLLINDPSNLAILSDKFKYITIKDNFLYVGASTTARELFLYSKEHNISGFEFLAHLPGSIGGAIKMNAGLKEYETFNNLVMIKTYKGYINKSNINFGYRFCDIKDIIYEGVFAIKQGFDQNLVEKFKQLRANQPKLPSAGSCFKNPPNQSTGKLLDEANLKGFKIGGMGFSQLHANFLVNYGSGTFKEALELINLAKDKVYKKFNIKLEEEIILI